MFSGTVIDEKTGITVAHALDTDENVWKLRPENGDDARQLIGQCTKKIQEVYKVTSIRNNLPRSEIPITADMAVLELEQDAYLRRNVVHLPEKETEYRVKIYKEKNEIPQNTKVMIIDQEGNCKHGVIRRQPFTDTKQNLYIMLGIAEAREVRDGTPVHELAITKEGDSGALVLSMPSEDSDVLYVYGIVTGLYSVPPNSLTIANCLPEVIPRVFSDQPAPGGIDFTSIGDHAANRQ